MNQYIRKINIVVANKGGKGIDVSNLHCRFSIKKTFVQTPNSAEVRIYNLAKDTAAQIKKEFSRVVVQAGYEGNYGLIFDGNIKQVKSGREGGTDTYLDIAAGDGDQALNFAVVNKTLAAGATPATVIDAASAPLSAHGVKTQGGGGVPGKALPRAKVMYGASRDVLRQATKTAGLTWSVQDGVLQLVEAKALPVGTAVELSPSSGLVGVPEETNEGTAIKCLLNPRLRINGPVALKSTDLDGTYKILSLTYTGDTRGNDWYCDLVGAKW